MKKESVKKIAVFDQGHPVYYQLMTRARELFAGKDVEFLRIVCGTEGAAFTEPGASEAPGSLEMRGLVTGSGDDTEHAPVARDARDSIQWDAPQASVLPACNPMAVTAALEAVLRQEQPDLLLMGATALGEEVAPALGIRLKTGVAAHCTEIRENEEGRIAFMVPAFGGKVIGEIVIPGSTPMIATVKPGMFTGTAESAGECRTVSAEVSAAPESSRGVQLMEVRPRKNAASNLDKADIAVCGGFGIGSRENWQKIEQLARRLGGAAGCTRPVVDMGWGPDEDSMIGTSGRTIRPKVYLGLGISGAAHHLCGIRDAGQIISINNDKDAEVFAASDYAGVFDAGQMLDLLLEKTE